VTTSEAVTLVGSVVRIRQNKGHGTVHMYGKLLAVAGDEGFVKPKGHKHAVWVDLRLVKRSEKHMARMEAVGATRPK
jgi:hypothetical protein